jgi:hypothetical protein
VAPSIVIELTVLAVLESEDGEIGSGSSTCKMLDQWLGLSLSDNGGGVISISHFRGDFRKELDRSRRNCRSRSRAVPNVLWT